MNSRSPAPPSKRIAVRRLRERGKYDKQTIYDIIDEALVGHLGFVDEGQPFVIPMLHCRREDSLYLHGSTGSRALGRLRTGAPACISFSLVDGLVLARAALHHSLNYRSVVVVGRATEVVDEAEKREVLRDLVEFVVPGRSDGCRLPTAAEVRRTLVLEIPLAESSAKIRAGSAIDDEDDLGLDHWAGVIPLSWVAGAPEGVPGLRSDVCVPDHVCDYVRKMNP